MTNDCIVVQQYGNRKIGEIIEKIAFCRKVHAHSRHLMGIVHVEHPTKPKSKQPGL